MLEILLKYIYLKRIIENLLQNQIYFFFRAQSLLRDKTMKDKGGLELVTISLQVLKQVQKNSFINDCYLIKSNDVI